MTTDNLIPFPAPAQQPQDSPGTEAEPAPPAPNADPVSHAEDAPKTIRTRVVVLVRGLAHSPPFEQFKAVAWYRLRHVPRDVAWLGWFFMRGHARWIAKGWTWATHGDLRADARAARLGGDQEARRTAQETIRADALARWAKIGAVARRITAAGLLITFLAGVLVLIDSQVPRAEMWPWLAAVYAVLGVLGVVVVWVLKVIPLGWLVAAIWEGRDRTPGAGWLVRQSREDADSWIDERMISQALAHLSIAPLDRFFKAGG